MNEPHPPALADFPVVITLPVQWGDQDAFGHVNNVVYFRWYESARIAYLDAAGLGSMMSQEGIGPILASITCNYRKQIKYPDSVHVGARIGSSLRVSVFCKNCTNKISPTSVSIEPGDASARNNMGQPTPMLTLTQQFGLDSVRSVGFALGYRF